MAQIPGTNIIAPVVPLDTTDVHPSHEARYGKGGYRTVATLVERDAIPAPRREAGMLVFVTADGKAYQLGSDLTTWAEFTSGVSSWNDLEDKPTEFPPSAHSHDIADVTDLSDALADKVPQAGGAMDSDAALTFSTTTRNSEVAGWGFGVEVTGGSQYATVEPAGFVASSSTPSSVVVSGITNSGDGYIAGIMGWGDPSGTLWSDLNGTYVRTSVAVRPSAYTDGNQGMHTPEAGTYNYYISNPSSMGSPSSAWNGIAYFLAPGNRSGWGDADNDEQSDPPVNYWRLVVLCDWPFTYFTNPSSNPYVFPTTGWVPVSASAPNGNEGGGYNGADYLGGYGGGFSVSAAGGGAAHLSAVSLTIEDDGSTTQLAQGALTLPNATQVRVGSFDNSTGGQSGISLICAVGNELNWQGGRLRNVVVGGNATPQPINCDSPIIFPGEGTYNVQVDAVGLTFSDGSSQTVAWTGSFSYEDLDDLPTLFDGAYTSLTSVPSSFAPTAHSHAIGDVNGLETALSGKQASGSYATLVDGLVPSAQLPSYVDDVLEYAALGNFPATGEAGKIYVATGTGKIYRWSGSTYVEISPSPGSTDSVTEGSTNLYYTNARASAAAPVQSVAGKAGTVSLVKGDVGLGSVDNTADTAKPVSTAMQTALDGKAATSHTHGNITNAGAIGSTSGQIVVTTTSGVLTTAATISNSQVSGLGTLATQSGTFSGTSSGTNTGDQTITLTGDVTGSGTGSFAATLSNTGVTAGTFTSVTVDAKGRVTAGSSPAVAYSSLSGTPSTFAPAAHNQAWSTITATPTTLSGYGITDAVGSSDARLTDARTPTSHAHGNITNAGAIGSTSGQIVVTTTSGVLTTAATISSAAVTGLPTAGTGSSNYCVGNDSRLSDARTPTAHKTSHATGGSDALTAADIGAAAVSHTHSAADLTSGTLDAARIPATAVTAGSYGSASSVATYTVDAAGRLTAAGSTSIALAGSAITSGTVAVARLPTVLEQTVTVGNSGTATTLSLANGSVQTVTLNGNCTFTMPSASAGASLTLILTQGGTNTATFTGVLWAGGTAPTITATSSKVDVLVFVSNGTSWFGTAAQNF